MREHNIQYIAHLSYYTNANGLLLVVYSKLGSANTPPLKHTARDSAHASEPKSRRKVHVENVHEVELPKDPVIVVGGGELVAREVVAREHHPAAETTAAPSRSRSDRGRTWSTKQLLRVIKIDWVDVDRHPCARKQVRIVRFARREHGWARAGDAAKEQLLVKGSRWVSREDRT